MKGGHAMMKKIHIGMMTLCLVVAWLLLRAAASYADVIMARDAPVDLYGNSSKIQVGDMITVNLSETVTVNTAISTSKKKSNSWKATAGVGLLKFLPSLERTGSSSHEDTNTDKQTQTISSSLTARVTSIEPNGNLVLEGSRVLWGNGRKVSMSLRGVARQVDIYPDNSVPSSRLLNLAIHVDGAQQTQPLDIVRTVVGTSPTD